MANNKANIENCVKLATEIDQLILEIRADAAERKDENTADKTYELESLVNKLGYYAGYGAAIVDNANAYLFEEEES